VQRDEREVVRERVVHLAGDAGPLRLPGARGQGLLARTGGVRLLAQRPHQIPPAAPVQADQHKERDQPHHQQHVDHREGRLSEPQVHRGGYQHDRGCQADPGPPAAARDRDEGPDGGDEGRTRDGRQGDRSDGGPHRPAFAGVVVVLAP